MNDLTVIYYTANHLDEIKSRFLYLTQKYLRKATEGIPIISVSQTKETGIGEQVLVGDIGRSHLNIYRQALIGAKKATTKYIALVEDDVLYHEDHFKHRPVGKEFLYNMNVWSIYTWVNPALFSYKDRRNLSQLICERELFIEAMEDRFEKWPDEEKLFLGNWAEPGKYEKNLGVTIRETGEFYSEISNVAFSHETALSFLNLGKRKKLGHLRALEIPYWGRAEEVLKMYE